MAQQLTLNVKNNSDQDLLVYQTYYSSDSIRESGAFSVSSGSEFKLIKRSGVEYIRVDFVAINQETNDTVCKITATEKQLNGEQINLIDGLNNLMPPLPFKRRLGIRGSIFYSGLEINDLLELKLKSKQKVSGKLISYSRDSVTLLNEKNEEITVTASEIKAIKCCSSLLTIGMRGSFFNYCKYRKSKNVKFQILEQRYNKKRMFWEWVEIE